MAISRARMRKLPSLKDMAGARQRQLTVEAENAAARIIKQLQNRRIELDWSQVDLALESGVTRETIRQMEAGEGKRNAPTMKTMLKLARAMGMELTLAGTPIIPGRLTEPRARQMPLLVGVPS